MSVDSMSARRRFVCAGSVGVTHVFLLFKGRRGSGKSPHPSNLVSNTDHLALRWGALKDTAGSVAAVTANLTA